MGLNLNQLGLGGLLETGYRGQKKYDRDVNLAGREVTLPAKKGTGSI